MIKNSTKSTVLQLRMSPKTKETAQKLLRSKGLTLSYAVNNFLNNIALHEDAMLLAYDQPKISEKTLKRWEKEIKAEVKTAKRFSSAKEAIAYLRSL